MPSASPRSRSRGKNLRPTLGGLFRQSAFGRLAGYEDVNDAERLAHDPAMRAFVGREGMDRPAASTSQMGRLGAEWLVTKANLAALFGLSGARIDGVQELKAPEGRPKRASSTRRPSMPSREHWLGRLTRR